MLDISKMTRDEIRAQREVLEFKLHYARANGYSQAYTLAIECDLHFIDRFLSR